MNDQSTVVKPTGGAQRNWLNVLLGLLLLLPAAVCCGTSLAAPTVQTFLNSLNNVNLTGPSQFVGAQNYARLPQMAGLGAAVGFTLAIALVRLLAVAVLPPILGLAAAALSRWLRGALRLLFTLPLALFAPTALAAGWGLSQRGPATVLSTPAAARVLVLFIDGLAALGVACGLALMAYVAARHTGSDGDPHAPAERGPAVVVWVVMAAAALASALQAFSLPFVLTGGGPGQATTTLAIVEYRLAWAQLRFGPALALASITLAILAVLGLVVWAVVVLGRVGLEVAPRDALPARSAGVAIVIALVAALLAVGLWFSSQAPMVQALFIGLGAPQGAASPFAQPGVLANTFLPPLAVVLIQLPVAYLAALGIGALRPLGRASEWLLLPFSPWLFVTIGPLSVAAFMGLRQTGQLNTIVALLTPIWVSVPMLFVLTLFFKGAARRWQAVRAEGVSAMRAFFGQVIGPSIPLALLLGGLGLLVSSQELLWSAIATTRQITVNVGILKVIGQLGGSPASLAAGIRLAVLPTFGLGFVVLALLQLFYVDRLALRRLPPAK